MLQVSVQDNGWGIAPQYQKKLFRQFYQVPRGEDWIRKGYGIGLASLVGIISVVQEWQPNVIVLDVEIGTKNGINVVPELKAIVPDTPILFVSSHIGMDNVSKALESGELSLI